MTDQPTPPQAGQPFGLGLGHAHGCKKGVPAGGGKVHAGFPHGWNLGCQRAALCPRDGQDANLAGRMLVSKLIDKGDGPAISERLETSLLIRESCGG